jgi:nitrile hydratase accessory protein
LSSAEPAQFSEPWEAQALALANELVRAGRFTPAEWADALGRAIRHSDRSAGPDDGSNYYLHVLSALEHLTTEKNIVTQAGLDERKTAWADAYEHTPHGRPVTLEWDRQISTALRD